ncbi:aldehyde dehydrogenase (NADP(+)) [Micromonospora sp. WMMD812]|uniref:aldehyde dehydrogenase (NADP(+)) n=1 Tax=Micromonospora sp. WMMD812 TaxID=3015152 RepID=UPI00248C8E98|nr:aldehyde dehydrogenase (NADP(+)) [Micromonospora sp. WMMD812]WBB68241.1 aldehyde dehydrogenase (NADP(+)) [Micromonospora sp. WMMD812]
MSDVLSIDPRTGQTRARVAAESTAEDVDRAVRAAATAGAALRDHAARADLLRAAAALLEKSGEEIVATADAETALGQVRLTGELARTCYQLRAFADVVDAGGYLDVIIDHADPLAQPAPRPDLRRYKVPLGVVAVFAASNFPLAFSVPGGDTASALAAGCPVVVKAHPDHPATSVLCARILRAAAVDVGLPEDVVRLVHGFDAGPELVRHPLVAAVGFTGSVRGGRALFDIASARPRPIPFHGELGSLNPVVVTARAAETRTQEIAAGLAASYTLGMGQFCVKPGLVLLPEGPAGDGVLQAVVTAAVPSGPLLDPRMRAAFLDGVRSRAGLPGVAAPLAAGEAGDDATPLAVRPGVLTVAASRLAEGGPHRELLEECFGPVTVLVRYGSTAERDALLTALPGNLTATAHLAANERDDAAAELLARLSEIAGRVVVDGWPTGVTVAPAMQHGGPYPASTSGSTSVGSTAIERWLRPVCYQNTPDPLLPAELRDANPLQLPRTVDGVPTAPLRSAAPPGGRSRPGDGDPPSGRTRHSRASTVPKVGRPAAR